MEVVEVMTAGTGGGSGVRSDVLFAECFFVDRKRYSKVRDHLHKRTVRFVSVVFLHSNKSLLEVFFGRVINDEMVVGEVLKARLIVHAKDSIGFCMILVDLSRHELMNLLHQRLGRNTFFRAEIYVIGCH